MINHFLICKSNHWPPRLKKVKLIVKKILTFHKDLNFDNNFEYNCNIILANNKIIKKLNKKFKKVNKSTDILTFVSEVKIKKMKFKKFCDIFISAEMVLKDSKKNNVNFYEHLAHLLTHSFLHINGYMHYKLEDFNKMKKVEINVLRKMEIKNPYLLD